MRWVVGDQDAECVLIGRPVPEAMRINTKALIEAFGDDHDGVGNVPELMSARINTAEEHEVGTLASFMTQSGLYHSHGGCEDDFIEKADLYIDLGEDSESDMEDAFDKSIAEASKTKCRRTA